ncbi:MAG: enoyl-CoA hydratase/isomerase family protein [Dehalococcoidia bacterium]
MSDESAPAVLLEVTDHVATITLNRPEQLNAINPQLAEELVAAFRAVRERDDVRVAVLTGNGRAFCAGADLKSRARGESGAGGPGSVFDPTAATIYETDTKKPLIGAINGYCLGGGFEVALTCDMLIASEQAAFALPEITLGFFPGGGAPVRLPRKIPAALANDMLFTGERIDAATALRYGIVSRVVPHDQLLATAQAMAAKIAGNAPVAVRAMREVIHRSADLPLGDALRLAATMRYVVGLTDDAKEGPRAFVEKRKPEYQGR